MDASSAFKDTLPTTPEALVETLENAGIALTRHEHPPLRTVEESKGCLLYTSDAADDQ